MPSVHQRYHNLATVVDDVHAFLDEWEHALEMPLDPFGLQVLKLAVHEWIANLVQHADFGGRQPDLSLTLQPENGRVRCQIEDNSRGFDFGRQVVDQHETLANAAAPPERGRGLLLMIACTENLSYRTIHPDFGGDGVAGPPLQRLEFWVSHFPPFDTTPAEAAFERALDEDAPVFDDGWASANHPSADNEDGDLPSGSLRQTPRVKATSPDA